MACSHRENTPFRETREGGENYGQGKKHEEGEKILKGLSYEFAKRKKQGERKIAKQGAR